MSGQLFHQIVKREGRIERVKRGQTPVIDLELPDYTSIHSIELEPESTSYFSDRKTVDWRWTVFLVYRFPAE